MDKVICNMCNWSWEKEVDDTHPELCHKCGFDNKQKMFNFTEFNKWSKKYNEQNEDKTDNSST